MHQPFSFLTVESSYEHVCFNSSCVYVCIQKLYVAGLNSAVTYQVVTLKKRPHNNTCIQLKIRIKNKVSMQNHDEMNVLNMLQMMSFLIFICFLLSCFNELGLQMSNFTSGFIIFPFLSSLS